VVVSKVAPPVRVGDLIVLISGVELPMFLRPSDDGFILLRRGYMYGVIYREGWSEEQTKNIQFRVV
jgi:hypothetical protein